METNNEEKGTEGLVKEEKKEYGTKYKVVLFFLFFFMGGNGFNGRQSVTTDDMQNQFNFASLERQNNEINKIFEKRNGCVTYSDILHGIISRADRLWKRYN